MLAAAIRAWLRAALLVPVVFALAIAAVIIAKSSVPMAQPAAGHPPRSGVAPEDQRLSPKEPTGLTIPLTVPGGSGGEPVILTVRITTTPPAAPDMLEPARGYLTGLLESLVTSLPAGWSPNDAGLATLRRALVEAVPVALAPSLPQGTHVTVSAEVAVSPNRPSP